MKFFGFRFGRTRARQAEGGEPPKSGGVLNALQRCQLVGADLDLTRESRWDEWFKNGPHVSNDFMKEREQPLAEDREPL